MIKIELPTMWNWDARLRRLKWLNENVPGWRQREGYDMETHILYVPLTTEEAVAFKLVFGL